MITGRDEFPISDIQVGKRLRMVSEAHVKALAESMDSLGLLQPILIDEDNNLIGGLHRLRAAQLLEWDEIGIVRTDLDGYGSKLAEIDENLIRNELDALGRAEHLARRKEIYQTLYPQTAPGGDRSCAYANGQFGHLPTFAEDTAEKTGDNRRSIDRAVQRAESIPQDVRDDIRDTPIAQKGVELDALAQLPPEAQRAAAKMVREGRATSIRDLSINVSDIWSQSEKRTKDSVLRGHSCWVAPKINPFLIAWAKDEKLFVDVSKTDLQPAKACPSKDDYFKHLEQLPNPTKSIAALRGKVLVGERLKGGVQPVIVALLAGLLEMPAPLLALRSTPAGTTKELKAKAKHHLTQTTGNDERYSPAKYADAARESFGRSIVLDPASCEAANALILADDFFTLEQDALHKKNKWVATTVWMNPPYSRDKIGPFCCKLLASLAVGDIDQAITLTNNGTSESWGQMLLEEASAVCFPSGRIKFYEPDGKGGVVRLVGSPPQGQMLCYFGSRIDEFIKEFKQFGYCTKSHW